MGLGHGPSALQSPRAIRAHRAGVSGDRRCSSRHRAAAQRFAIGRGDRVFELTFPTSISLHAAASPTRSCSVQLEGVRSGLTRSVAIGFSGAVEGLSAHFHCGIVTTYTLEVGTAADVDDRDHSLSALRAACYLIHERPPDFSSL